jgi:phosphoribosylformylglycinamidine synthase II
MTTETQTTPQHATGPDAAIALGLTKEEYDRICSVLGRDPNYAELSMYSVMWSEHCSYKNSIAEIKKLPRNGPRLLAKAGEENAGLVDIGGGYAVAFKIESHNHPSAVEPYQGAATGVGGILRDIFTMGARPVAALNSLRFGDPASARTRFLLKGVVKGIGDYGNSFGVPTVAGEVYFDPSYNENPLVNAMAVGIVRHDRVVRAISKGEGNLVMIVGSSTGRDGIHGATFASEEISEASESKRPSVQVGDPFTEKLLMEATLEAIRGGFVVGMQDMGAAGITCSTCEMSAKGETGIDLDLGKVPLRETGMAPFEILLSESQERMLVVVRPEHEADVRKVFGKWDLQCEIIGRVTGSKRVEITRAGEHVGSVPSESLVLGGGAPVYIRDRKEPRYYRELKSVDLAAFPEPRDYREALERLLGSPNICSRRWVTTQYDSMVRTNTVNDCYLDAAVIRLKETDTVLSMKTDCNSRYVYLDPYMGGMIAVAECARNLVAVGTRPLTNCLNFGNPYKPEIYWQFSEAIRGIGEACTVLGTPVTGGNVSFYNENPEGAVYPTPVIGMVGEAVSLEATMTADFKTAGDLVLVVGETHGAIGGSEYLARIHGKVGGAVPVLDIHAEKRLQDLVLDLIGRKLIVSAHDCSEGGLAVAVAESLIGSLGKGRSLGIAIELPKGIRPDHFLFGEDQSRIVVSTGEANLNAIKDLAGSYNVPVQLLGRVTTDGTMQAGTILSIPVRAMAGIHDSSLETLISG